MATPYLQIFPGVVPSTQDIAKSELEDLPLAVIAPGQTAGRGRTGSHWETADRALAASVALRVAERDLRPFSLIAGVAAVRSIDAGVRLKWPNDLILGSVKVGGILVERSEDTLVAGLGVNLYWASPPEGAGAISAEIPGETRYREVGALWVAEFMAIVATDGWPHEEYREHCLTLGRSIRWDPDGSGKAIDVAEDGSLIVDIDGKIEQIHAGAVRHIH